MSPGGEWDDAVVESKEIGFYIQFANAFNKNGPVYNFWKTKQGITVSAPQQLSFSNGFAVVSLTSEIKKTLNW